jgi:hypothetical protein
MRIFEVITFEKFILHRISTYAISSSHDDDDDDDDAIIINICSSLQLQAVK